MTYSVHLWQFEQIKVLCKTYEHLSQQIFSELVCVFFCGTILEDTHGYPMPRFIISELLMQYILDSEFLNGINKCNYGK